MRGIEPGAGGMLGGGEGNVDEDRPCERGGSGGGKTRELGGAGREEGGEGGAGRDGGTERDGGIGREGGGIGGTEREGGGIGGTEREGGGSGANGREGGDGGRYGAAPEMLRPCASAGARVGAGGVTVEGRVSFAAGAPSARGERMLIGAVVSPRTEGRGGG